MTGGPARARTAGLLFVVVLALLVHARALGGEFFFDDLRFVVDNPRIAEVGNPARFFTDPTCQDPAHPTDIYRPLRTLVFAVERSAFGLRPAPFHAVQVLLHALCAALVYLLLIRIGLGPAAAAAGAAIFAVHPAQVEAVAWISSLADVLGALFTLVAIHAWLRSRGPDRWYAAAILAGLLASLSKEAALVFPGFLVLVDLVRPDGGGPGRVRASWKSYLLPFLVAAILGGIVRSILLDARGGQLGHIGWWGGSWWTNLATAAKAAAFQGIFAALPFVPSTEWYITPAASPLEPLAVLCGLGVLGLLGFAVYAVVRGGAGARRIGTGLLLFALGGLMTSHVLFTVGIPRTDRFLYLSLVGAALVHATVLERLLAVRPRLAAAAAVAAVLGMAAISFERIAVFRDVDAFWRGATAGLPGPRPESRFIGEREKEAVALLDAGRSAEARDRFEALAREVDEHVDRWTAVVGFRLDQPMAGRMRNNLALARLRCGDPSGALEETSRALAIDPRDARALHIGARALRALGRLGEAGWRIERSLDREPRGISPTEAAEVLNEVAALRLSRGLDGAALRALRLSVALVPDARSNAVVEQLPALEVEVADRRKSFAAAAAARPGEFAAVAARILYEGRGGSPDAARAAFAKAFPVVPGSPAVRVLWATATMEADDREEGWRTAEAYHRQTLVSAPRDAGSLLGVARSCEALGDWAAAIRAWREVLALPGVDAGTAGEAREGLRRAGE